MNKSFAIDFFDAELSRRTSVEEWQRILTMRNSRRFYMALPAYHDLISNYFADHRILGKLVTEAWRFEMLVYALYLYDQHNDDDPRSGLTVANLQKICASQECASAGRVLAFIRILRLGGFLHRQQSPLDNRVVQLAPSPKFISLVEGWNQRIFKIIDEVFTQKSLAQYHQAHPRFGWEMRRRGAEHLLKGWKLLAPFPEVSHFVTSNGGWMLLLHCVAETLRLGASTSGDHQIVPIAIDLVIFGRRFGVSRSHLRRLLESAHVEGLLDAPPHNGAYIQLAPHLVAAFLTCMASELGSYRDWGLAAAPNLRL